MSPRNYRSTIDQCTSSLSFHGPWISFPVRFPYSRSFQQPPIDYNICNWMAHCDPPRNKIMWSNCAPHLLIKFLARDRSIHLAQSLVPIPKDKTDKADTRDVLEIFARDGEEDGGVQSLYLGRTNRDRTCVEKLEWFNNATPASPALVLSSSPLACRPVKVCMYTHVA